MAGIALLAWLRSGTRRRRPRAGLAYLAEFQNLLDNIFDETERIAEIDRIETLIAPVTGDISADLDYVRNRINAHRVLVQAGINSPPTGFSSQPLHFCIF